MFQNIFMTRNRTPGHCITQEMKLLMLETLAETGSLEFTRRALEEFDSELCVELERIEQATGVKNPGLWHLVQRLKV